MFFLRVPWATRRTGNAAPITSGMRNRTLPHCHSAAPPGSSHHRIEHPFAMSVPAAPAHRPALAIALMMGSLMVFACLDTLSKVLAQRQPLPLLICIRYAVQCFLMVAILGPLLGRGLIRTRRPLPMFLRGCLLIGCTTLGISSLRVMPLGEMTALLQTSPMIVALLAGPWLGETVTRQRWVAIGIGFLGVLILVRPGGNLPWLGVVLTLGNAFVFSVYQLMTRQLAGENTYTLWFYPALVGTLVTSAALPFLWEGPLPNLIDGLLMASLGVIGGLGHLLQTRAFRYAPVSLLTPFLYVALVWANLMGWLVFDQLPDAWALLGMAIIAGSGLWNALSTLRRR